MRFSVSSQSSVSRPLQAVSQQWSQCSRRRTEAYPATSLTKPRSSSTLSMLCRAPPRMLRLCVSHSACREAESASSAAHFFAGRSPRASVCWLRSHGRRQTCCGRPGDRRRSISMAVNGSARKTKLPSRQCEGAAIAPACRQRPCTLPRPPPHRTCTMHVTCCLSRLTCIAGALA